MKFLLAGWFSFEQMGASAGDLLARDLVRDWLHEEQHSCDIAVAAPFSDGIAWQDAEPAQYGGLIFVCGPFGNGPPLVDFLAHFAGLPLIGVNLTMLQRLDEWNPFDLLLERDSSATSRPDLVFATSQPRVPVAGLVLVHHQSEYRDRARHTDANEALQELIDSRELAVIPIDTRLDDNQVGLRTSAEVESLIARMDVVLTTRLHGMVLALKNGVPALVVDPIAGGAKISRQAKAIGWDKVYVADALKPQELQSALDYCLSAEGGARARRIAERAAGKCEAIKQEFVDGIRALAATET